MPISPDIIVPPNPHTKLLDGYNSNPEVKKLVDMFDWYVLPVANPDGYVYSWKSDQVPNFTLYTFKIIFWTCFSNISYCLIPV